MKRISQFLLRVKRAISFTFIVAGLLISLSVKAQLPTAPQISSQMKVGWNLGNTLEAICGETAWNGGVLTTQALIDKVKASGFNTVRLPCAWDCHTTNGVIDAAWIARVKQIVDYCVNDNLYVILNIHWDGGWLDDHINATDQASVIAKQKNYWTQIANYFKNYNEHLLFAGSNEPPAKDATQMTILLSYHKAFIDAVRTTGGNNSSRTLIVQGPSTDFELTYNLMNTMPSDWIASRLMVEVHYYTPYQFCLMNGDASWGNMFYYWGNGYHSTTDVSRNATWGEESYAEQWFGNMKTKFVDKGIPVIVGEYGAYKRTLSPPSDQALHNASVEYYHKYIVNSAVSKGIIPFIWDVNGFLYNRSTLAVNDQGVLNAIMQGAGNSTTYVTLTNRATGLLIDGMGRTSDGSNAGQWSSSGSNAQKWTMETSGSNVKFKNVATGLYLDGMGRNSNGSLVGQWGSSSSWNQLWTIETYGNYKRIKNAATGLYIDGMYWSSNGSDLGQWSDGGSDAQQWTITSLKSVSENSGEISSANEGNCDIVLYPNPFISDISLRIDNPEQVTSIVLLDILGKQVEVIDQASVKLEQTIGSSLKAGIYVVQVYGVNWTKSFKVVKKK